MNDKNDANEDADGTQDNDIKNNNNGGNGGGGNNSGGGGGSGGGPKNKRRQLKKLRQELRDVQKAPPTVVVGDVAPRARMKRRHYGVVLSFLLFVVLPAATVMWYL